MELTREESKRILRRIELEAYSALVTALRAQGELDRQKKRLLRELGEQLSISTERHRAEIRRAISDDRLSMIAECVCGSDASVEWESEGRRVVPLMPRLVPQTAFTGAATAAANHAASVNATIPSTAKGRLKDVDEDFKSRKRQRTSSPGTIQKVIVSSAPKTTATVRNNNAVAKDASRFSKTPTLPVKQDSSQLSSVSMKMMPSGSSGVSSKPIILGGSKPSSVSVAPSKYVAPLPASCLQAHASVVSATKNRMNLNVPAVVKTKPKPKFKPLAASVKIRPVSAGHGTSTQGSSVAQTLAQSLLTAAKIKTNEVAKSTTSKPVQVSRSSTSTITVAPRSSISLTAFKTTIQPKPNPQAPGTVLGKSVSVSRLSRPLPAILPKTIPPKALTTVSSPGRKLASILPAPAKSTSSTIPSPRIVPVSSAASSPIPIAPSPRPPQPFTAGLTSSVMSRLTTVSMATGQSADLKRDSQDTSSEVKVQSPVLFGKSPAGSQNSSPMSSKSLDNIHEREALSPVNEILTLVTSPSSVPFVPSSPVKSTATPPTSGEISLECEENLLEDLIKDEEIQVKKRTKPPAQVPFCMFPQKQDKPGAESTKNILTSSNLGLIRTFPDVHQNTAVTLSDLSHVIQSLQEENKSNPEPTLMLKDTSTGSSKTAEITPKPIDMSPLVDELLSNPFDFDEKQLENLDVDTCDVVGVEGSVSDLFVGGFPVLDVGDLSDVSETVKLDVGDVISTFTGEEKVIKQLSPVAKLVDKNIGLLKPELAVDQQKGFVDTPNVDKQKEFGETKKEILFQDKDVLSNINEQAESNPIGVNMSKQVEKVSTMGDNNIGDPSGFNQNAGLKDNGKLRDDIVVTSEFVKAIDEQRLFEDSKQEGRALPNFPNIAEAASTSQGNIAVSTAATSIQISRDSVTGNTAASTKPSVNTSSETMEPTEDKKQPAVPSSNLGSEVKNQDYKINTTRQIETQTKEIVKSIADEMKSPSKLGEGSSKDSISTTAATQAEESCETNMTQPFEVSPDLSSKDDVGRQENMEEQFSGSEAGSLEGNLVRTSNRKRKAPPPRDLSLHPPGWVRSALQLLQKVSRFRGSSRSKNARSASSWFLKPVGTTEAPGYYKVIKCPMDFGTIKTKLEASEYHAPADFHHDMLLVKSNCFKYNPPGHVVRKDCDEVFQFYEAEYERFVEKLDKIYLSTPKKQKSSPV